MTSMPSYDAVIIGAGQAGIPLARGLAQAGWRTALVEREHVGGTCYNEGCTPTKTMIASARVAYLARRAGDFGVRTGTVGVDMAAVRQRKRDLVESWRAGSERRLRATDDLDLLMAEASFVGSHQLEIRPREGSAYPVEAARIFVNTGARPAVPSLPGLDAVPFFTSTTIMEVDRVPEHLLILGGGYIAVEFGQMFRRFGSEVTIVQRHDTLLPREDSDVAQAIAAILKEDGVKLVFGADARRVARVAGGSGGSGGAGGAGGGVSLELATATGAAALTGSHLLVATGRTPNTEGLNLQAAGLEVDSEGYIPANERLETKVSGIYALGDVKGGPAFTHISYDDYRIIRTNLLEGGAATIAERPVPYTIFMDPQLGRVGLTEREAREKGLDVRVLTLPMDNVARALEVDESRGFMKAVVDRATDRIVGFAALGIEGGELMAIVEVAMFGGVTASTLREAIFAHPTLAESLNNLFAG
jgi:pyruvate/2-oxoglutarate dehydrogenase complex dihydrolipoamide dehydrogenase (E3) component